MPSELQNLDTIFNSRVFRIPDYQRGYAWGEQQLRDFWDDLDRLDNRRNHYGGQLTLESVPDDAWRHWDEETWLIEGKGYKPFYVVDGQQRLTTAIILIKCVLDRVPDGGQLAFTDKSDHIKKYLLQSSGISRAYIFGYQRDNPSYEYLKTQILDEPSNQYQGTETTYTTNLWYARGFFNKKVAEGHEDEIERWFKTLTQKFLFNIHELVEDLDVFVVFETMNNRGKQLSRLELLKNRLIYLSTLLPATSRDEGLALRRNVNEAWKTVFEYLGREKDDPLDDDEFLRAHWIMYFRYARDRAGQFATFLLNETFTAQGVRDRTLSAGQLQKYVDSVQESARVWHDIHFPERATTLSDGVRHDLECLDRLGRGAFEPLLMAAMQKAAGDNSGLSELLQAAERFIFVVSRLCNRRADTGDSEFYRLAGEIFRGERSLAEAVRAVNERTNSLFSVDSAVTALRDLFQQRDEDENSYRFYGWRALRYFLFEYEQHLKKDAGMGASKIDWRAFTTSKRDQETVEHIYPMTPVAGEWLSFEARPQRELAILLNSLGNLFALSQPRNSKFSNRRFSAKQRDAEGVSGYYNGSYSEIRVARSPDWTPDAVLTRGLEMVDFLEKRWDISLGSKSDRVRFLNLEFLTGDDQPQRRQKSRVDQEIEI